MNYKYFYFILLFAFCFSKSFFAQGNYLPSVIPPSPQSEIFERYLNHKITEYNGLPDITIPLYEIRMKGMTIPVMLTYHAGGVKFRQYDGDVGAGWSLNIGGYRVMRTINNKPDNSSIFYDQNYFETLEMAQKDMYMADICNFGGDNNTSPLSMQGAWTEYPGLDSEQDFFTYITPSTSGSFIITDRGINTYQGNSKLIATTLENPLDKIVLPNSLYTISLTDDNGFLYSFGGGDKYIEKTSSIFNNLLSNEINTWTLKQITSPFDETVNYNYSLYPGPGVGFDYGGSFVLKDAALTDYGYDIGSYPTDWNYLAAYTPNYNVSPGIYKDLLFLTEMESTSEKIIIERNAVNNPNFIQWKCLINKIVITDKATGNILRQISFEYEQYSSHQLLKSITIQGSNVTNETQKYQFDYYKATNNADITDSSYPDEWGYYKTGASCLFPLHEDFKNGVFVYVPGQYQHVSSLNQFDYYFSKNRINNSYSYIMTLKKIIFPTGGYTEYEYEPNQFISVGGNSTVIGGGHRVKRISSRSDASSPPIITEFKYGINENGIGQANIPLNFRHFADEKFYAHFYDFHSLVYYVERTFSSHPTGNALQDMFQVSYPEVTVYKKSETGITEGKIVSNYSNDNRYLTDWVPLPSIAGINPVSNFYCPLDIVANRPCQTPLLISRRTFNQSGQIVNSEYFRYICLGTEFFSGLRVNQRIFISNHQSTRSNPYPYGYNPYDYISSFYTYMYTTYTKGKEVLQEKRDTLFLDGNTHIKQELYTYDSNSQLIKKEIKNASNNKSFFEDYTYPTSQTALITKNMLSTVIQSQSYINSTSNLNSFVKHNYPSNSILPSSTEILGSRVITYNKYDLRGNIIQYTDIDNIPVSFIWSYNYQYPIAKIKNATYDQVKSALSYSDDQIESLSTQANPNVDNISNLLRTNLPNAQVTTYTYKPLVGMATMTNPQGITTYYDYDAFGRLKETYYYENNDTSKKRIVETFDYHYKSD